MNDTARQDASLQPEVYHTLSVLITAIGVGFGIWGICNLLEGYGKNISAAREAGEKQIKTGANLAVLAAYIEKGTLPPPEMIEYLTSR